MSTLKDIHKVVSDWEHTGEMSIEMAQTIESRFEDFMREELDKVRNMLKKGKPHQAFGQLNRLFAIVNMTFITYPHAYLSFNKWINVISQIVESIVKHNEFDAKEPRVQISIGIPHGFSINISFEV